VYEDGSNTLTVFLSAMHPHCYDGLLTQLVEMAEVCYNIDYSKLAPHMQRGKPKRKKPKREAQARTRYVPSCCFPFLIDFLSRRISRFTYVLVPRDPG
jgi:hypothetical protein